MIYLTHAIDKDSLAGWSFSGPVKKAYDKTCKGFILLFEHSTKAMIPVDPRNSEDLHLVQPYLMMQIMITDKKVFHLEITVTDQHKIKRRLFFNAGQSYSPAKDNISKQQLHARIPFDIVRDGVWMNLQLDILNFYEACFPGEPPFRSLDGIIITGACRIRKVLTMRSQLFDTTA